MRKPRSQRPLGATLVNVVLGVAVVFAVGALLLTLRPVDVAGSPAPLVVPELPDPRDRARNLDGGELVDVEPEEPAASPVAIGGIPEQLDRRQLEAAMAKVRPAVLHCRGLNAWGGYAGELSVHMTITASGGLGGASIVGVPPEEAHTPLGDCVLRAVRNIYFPRFRGAVHPTMEWTYPFVLRD